MRSFALLLRSTTLAAACDDILETQTVVGSPGNYSVQAGAPFSFMGEAPLASAPETIKQNNPIQGSCCSTARYEYFPNLPQSFGIPI